MPLTVPSIPIQAAVWATNIIAGIDQTGMSVDEKAALLTTWTDLCTAHITFITVNALSLTTGVTATGPPGGPLGIIVQPGVIT